jgi:hypothetical protein
MGITAVFHYSITPILQKTVDPAGSGIAKAL